MSALPILQPISFVEDIDAANDYQRKHTPHLEVEKIDGGYRATVSLGYYVDHAHDKDHFFDWVELLVDDTPFARFFGAPGISKPEYSVILTEEFAGKKLGALSSCNLHGVWKAEVSVD